MFSGSNLCATSESISSQVSQHPTHLQIFSLNTNHELNRFNSIYLEKTSEYFSSEDMEDDENREHLSFRKYKTVSKSALAATHAIHLSIFHNYSSSEEITDDIVSCLYITQRTLRI
jgi:hypothetical protein